MGRMGNGMVTQSEESITLNDVLPAFLTTTADPSHSFRMTFYRPLSLRTGGRKRIFILFFCVVPPSQYPPSGFAGHLLINKEAYPIPILSVRIPFLNTVADPSLMSRMTFNVLYKDHGVGRQKELLAHAVRLRILACRNDLNRKGIVSLQLTAHS